MALGLSWARTALVMVVRRILALLWRGDSRRVWIGVENKLRSAPANGAVCGVYNEGSRILRWLLYCFFPLQNYDPDIGDIYNVCQVKNSVAVIVGLLFLTPAFILEFMQSFGVGSTCHQHLSCSRHACAEAPSRKQHYGAASIYKRCGAVRHKRLFFPTRKSWKGGQTNKGWAPGEASAFLYTL